PCGAGSRAGAACGGPGRRRRGDEGEERDPLRVESGARRAEGFAGEWRDEPVAGRFCAAIFHPGDAVLQPARCVRRLAVLAAEAGAEIREHERGEALADPGTDPGPVATHGYPSGLLGVLRGLIVPTPGPMIAPGPPGG